MDGPTKSLSGRDLEIVKDTVRAHIMTNEIVHEFHFDNQRPNAVTRVTSRLCRDEWLGDYPLIYPRKYFVPGKRSISLFGLSECRSFPLGPQSLPTEYAALQYTFNRQNRRLRISTDEIRSRLPWYSLEWCTAPHCVRMENGDSALEMLRIDLGGPADHVARKCQSDIERREGKSEFRDLVGDKLFRLVVITSTTDKAAAIQRSLDGHVWPTGLNMHIAVITDLLPLVPRS